MVKPVICFAIVEKKQTASYKNTFEVELQNGFSVTKFLLIND